MSLCIMRVAAYCRVSTDLEEQQGSLKIQMSAFYEYIRSRPGWELAGIYADEGVSGTQAARRPEFNRLMADCEAGKIDYILTKSISRFARNTLECLSYVRRLKERGIYILFEKEGLDTGHEASELVLSIMAAVAQEESRSISENVKWGIRKRFEAGWAKWSPTYGYRREGDHYYLVDEATAPVVRWIFKAYARGKSLAEIVSALEAEGIAAPGGGRWWVKTVDGILKNEKYVGDAALQKSLTINHLTHERVRNDGSLAAQYYIREHHRAIVDRKTYEMVQLIRKLKDTRRGPVQYPWHGFLLCPCCGKPLVRGRSRERGRPAFWYCSGKEGERASWQMSGNLSLLNGGRAGCGCYLIYEKYIDEAFRQAHAGVDKERFHDKPGERIEYYMLDAQLRHVDFPNWNNIRFHWKDGGTTAVDVIYSRDRDIPGHREQEKILADIRGDKRTVTVTEQKSGQSPVAMKEKETMGEGKENHDKNYTNRTEPQQGSAGGGLLPCQHRR